MKMLGFMAIILIALHLAASQCPDTTSNEVIGLCVEECSGDGECGAGEVCCSNGCGHTCFPSGGGGGGSTNNQQRGGRNNNNNLVPSRGFSLNNRFGFNQGSLNIPGYSFNGFRSGNRGFGRGTAPTYNFGYGNSGGRRSTGNTYGYGSFGSYRGTGNSNRGVGRATINYGTGTGYGGGSTYNGRSSSYGYGGGYGTNTGVGTRFTYGGVNRGRGSYSQYGGYGGSRGNVPASTRYVTYTVYRG